MKASANEATRNSVQRFFKEAVNCYGVRSGVVEKIARKHWKEIAHASKKDIFELCEELKRWTGSPNRWLRRAGAVSLIIPAKKGKYLRDVFDIAGRLHQKKYSITS